MKVSGAVAFLQTCTLVFALFLPVATFADGKVLPSRGYPIPDIPDQSAMLCCAGNSETLVIETSFIGQGTNFAWIVPLPSAPKIEPVSTGLFPTLQMVFQPQVVLSVRPYWVALPIAAMFILLFRLSKGETGCLFLVLGSLLVLAVLLLPALVPARTRSNASSDVTQVRLLNRQSAGLFDTVTLQSSNAAALLQWLDENGFKTPTNLEPVVSAYIREGWVFAAARLHSEPVPGEVQATHPLAFTFKTARPVYPLRLTGVGARSCRVDLYVFGPSRAHVDGFAVRRCGRPDYAAEPGRLRLATGDLRVRHPDLAKFAGGAAVATKLSATLSAADMGRDAYIGWVPYWAAGSTTYTRGAAKTLSANIGALLFAVLISGWWLLSRFKPGFEAGRWGPWLTPAALVVAVGVYLLAIPKINNSSVRVLRSRSTSARFQAMVLANLLDRNLPPAMIAPWCALPPEQLQRLLLTTLADLQTGPYVSPDDREVLTNYFTGQPIRFEASPGNYVLRPAGRNQTTRLGYVSYPATNSLELVWHDVDGAETATNLITLRTTVPLSR